MEELIYEEETYKIRGAVFEVYREIGCGFLEAVYQECLELELRSQDIPFISQNTITLAYKGKMLQQKYKPDLVCYYKIILELKAEKKLTLQNEAQMLNYLKATGMRLGLLINYGSYPKAEIKRIAL